MSESRPVAIVTGGAKGIGAACVELLARSGFNVVFSYVHSLTQAEAIAGKCIQYENEVIALRSDVSSDSDCIEIADHAHGRWGRIDVLVNNAGITRFANPADLTTLNADDFAEIFAVNVSGAYQMTRAVTSYIGQSPIASIVNISSHSGFSGVGSSIAYAASKGALNTLTLSLARSLAPKIRVNGVCPGFVDTDWLKPKLNTDELVKFKQKASDIAPLKRLVTPEEVAEAVSWFSLGGKSITGQLLVIDGGTHLTVGDPL
jgi:3-oxoacyl-[acyl-carrier protein] reductase